MKRTAIAALLAALLLAACSGGPATVAKEEAGPIPEGSTVVPEVAPPGETPPPPEKGPPVENPPPPVVAPPPNGPDSPGENQPLVTETVVSL